MLSNQEYFTGTVNYLRKQKKRASNGQYCRYCTSDGNRCAIGHWIPDGHALLTDTDQSSQQSSVRKLADIFPELGNVAWPGTEDGLDLAWKLQMLHDGVENRKSSGGGLSYSGEKVVSEIAMIFSLRVPELIEQNS